MLATVSAIIAQTQEASSPRADFVTGLISRINSLARTHELLSESSERHKSERTLAELNAQLALAAKAALVGSHADDPGQERMTISEGYAAIHGLPEGTTETTRRKWRARVHPDDLVRLEETRPNLPR